MSLYDGLSVETAPIPEISEKVKKDEDVSVSAGGWSSDFKLMASQLQRKKASKKVQQKPRPQVSSAVLEPLVERKQMAVDVLEGQSLLFDDLAVEIEDEYNPMLPNNYEKVIRERREEHDRIREEERKRRREEREKERKSRRRRRSDGSSSGSDDDRSYRSATRRKDTAAAIPPPSVLANQQPSQKPEEEKTVVQSALEELSRKKAQRKVNPFGKPKFGAVASKIMSKYGWEEGQGLGKASQGISTALSVEKTSRRGGKIVNAAAGIEEQIEQDRKKVQSMAELMKNPTKIVLLQNMVGPGEVDEDLEPETAEECTKYGEVEKCVIFEIPHGAPDNEAVRIFVGFTRLESAIKAVIDLNGRYFGGRVISAAFFPEERFTKLDLAP